MPIKNQTETKERVRRWFRHLNPRQADRERDIHWQAQRDERIRVARELHDTLFQGFLGSKMRLQAWLERMPEDSPGKSELNRIADQMDRAIEEGREAVRGLRSFAGPSPGFEQALARVRAEVAPRNDADFRMFVNGNPRRLNHDVQAEIFHIGREALINALRHSGAKSIEIEIEYSSRCFRLTARDNGCGIDRRLLKSVPDARWGLVGMRERADGIGARLRVLSRLGGGTEVEVSIPGDAAYEKDNISFFPTRRRLART
jgi:signal transduction histidine kinase